MYAFAFSNLSFSIDGFKLLGRVSPLFFAAIMDFASSIFLSISASMSLLACMLSFILLIYISGELIFSAIEFSFSTSFGVS